MKRLRSTVERRSFLQTAALAGTGIALATGPQRARADHTDCPVADRFVPSPNYGTREEDVDWIVIHVTTGPYTSAIRWFENPDSNVSAHYVVSNYDDTDYEPGHVTQMVHHEDNAWHARTIANHRSIGIELEWENGHNPAEPISEECYEAAAQLVRCIADEYDVPLEFYDEETCIQDEPGGIIGHTHVPDGDCSTFDHDGRTCPYPDFDPVTFMDYVTDEDDEDDEDGDEDGNDDSGGFCFITTATAPDDATLHSLRRFRDESMAGTPAGRALVGLYYRLSPPIARTLERHPDSRAFQATRKIIETCASLSDRQAETDSRIKSASIGAAVTGLYVVGTAIGASGHVAIRARERLSSRL